MHDADVGAIVAGLSDDERALIPHMSDGGLVYPLPRIAQTVPMVIKRARVAVASLRAKGLAQHGPLYDEDTGAPKGSGTWLNPIGLRVQAAVRARILANADATGRGSVRGEGIEVLDLFSAAAGGWSLGMHRAGYTTIAACEVEAWRRAIYSENNPGVKVYDDVRTLTADRLRDDLGRLPTVVVGSPPCQDISSANTKGRGVEGARSGLYFEAIRIIGEVRPRWFALENSANLRTRGADAVIAALEGIGYACWPVVVRAGDVGANHERPRAWLIGCDLEQVADADGFGRNEGWSRGRVGLNVAVPGNPSYANRHGEHASPVHEEMAELRWMGGDCGGGEAADAHGYSVRIAVVSGGPEPEAAVAGDADKTGNAAHADQARQAHGCMEPGLRQAEIADDGRGAGRGDDGPRAGQMGLCPPDRSYVDRSRDGWSLADLADHLRLDDGLSARLAGTRVAVGDGKGQSAASLVVEAFGDAVIPQIPEAIGRAILRVERALAAIHERIAA